MHLDSYLQNISNVSNQLTQSVISNSKIFYEKITEHFDYKSETTGLLLGNVQSGKTAQIFGIITKLADENFEIFILLTSDSNSLQQQTLQRAFKNIHTFNICGELDDVRFFNSGLRQPILLVIKKNAKILKKWRNNISASKFCLARPIVIIDDEADAASLNTLVNKDKISAINSHLGSMKSLASSSLYLQVTATPQAILLQSNISAWKPKFVHYFAPGDNYIGGDFVYSSPTAFCIEFTDQNELNLIKDDSDQIPIGLRQSLLTYLIVCAEFNLTNKVCCNFLVHPSVRIADHQKFAETLGHNLNTILSELSDEVMKQDFWKDLSLCWSKLQTSHPDINSFDDIKSVVEKILLDGLIKIKIMNSKSANNIQYDKGFNIIIGGNSLGRGLTLPNLQIVYYCRQSKAPQADTCWQHSRVFGYDRVKGLLRVFIPKALHEIFTDINDSNKLMIKGILENSFDESQLVVLPGTIKPTRSNVLDEDYVNVIQGGVNYFPLDPIQNSSKELDSILDPYIELKYNIVDGDLIIKILDCHIYGNDAEWNSKKYQQCVKALILKRPLIPFKLIVRTDRDVSKGTGTLLSPTDRTLGTSMHDSVVLTMYRVNGAIDKKWSGKPFWIPNIKLPSGSFVYYTIDT